MKRFLIFVFLIFVCLAADKVFAADKVEINTAPLQQLEALIGIGPVKAQAIIGARPFSSIDDLLRVSGIGEKTLQRIKDQGLAYVGEKSEIQNPKSETNPNDQISNSGNITPKTQNQTPTIIYPSGVVFNEILPSPEGADETEEWIEIYNKNSFEVNLSDWKIYDIEGKITNYIFPNETKIKPNGYIMLTRPITKITLNNTKDGLAIMQPDGKIADEASYQNAPKNQSYNKTSSGWIWSEILTPNSKNIISAKSKIANGKIDAPKNTDSNDKEKLLASLSQTDNKNSNFKNTFFIAIGVIAISTTIFYYLKRFLIKNA